MSRATEGFSARTAMVPDSCAVILILSLPLIPMEEARCPSRHLHVRCTQLNKELQPRCAGMPKRVAFAVPPL